jgi:hypothetical protein
VLLFYETEVWKMMVFQLFLIVVDDGLFMLLPYIFAFVFRPSQRCNNKGLFVECRVRRRKQIDPVLFQNSPKTKRSPPKRKKKRGKKKV